jgi:hypothetical protein
MGDRDAQPGDVIEITVPGHSRYGKRFEVIECPGEHKKMSGDAWFNTDGYPCYARIGNYLIVTEQPSSQDTKGVDESLKRQRDANLGSVFS